jgi:hypothetical protein
MPHGSLAVKQKRETKMDNNFEEIFEKTLILIMLSTNLIFTLKILAVLEEPDAKNWVWISLFALIQIISIFGALLSTWLTTRKEP